MSALHQHFIRVLPVVGALLCLHAQSQERSSVDGDWFLEGIHVPQHVRAGSANRAIVIAVVDDGVRVSHRDLQGFIWRNRKEVPANGIDDDGNGYIDDVNGWDAADGDNSVTPPAGRLEEFYHGTHLAGVITQIARRTYGESATDRIQIMPVKTLSDRASQTYLRDGYKGIEYAVQAGADIILAAWSVGHISAEETRILREAESKGVLVVASAGNFSQGTEQYPAADEAALAVAALNQQNKKTEISNYGAFVDLAAPGIDILSAGVRSDTDYTTREGTSQAAAMVAAAASIVKQQHTAYSWRQVTACLKQSADPADAVNPRFTAALGAGKLNLAAAVECDLISGEGKQAVALVNPQGYLHFDKRRGKTASWTITPHGEFNGLRFRPQFNSKKAPKGTISFYAGKDANARLVTSHPLAEMPESVYVAGTTAHVEFKAGRSRKSPGLLLDYKAEPIDFPRLYCRDTINLDIEGVIDDGSGPEDYSYNSSCKWLITAPEGKVIRIKFTEFDTEAKIDKVYFFDGSGTHEEIMAIFSGPDIPPELTTWHNQVLVWFVSDAQNQSGGWRAEYRFVDP
jgi:hypothetical protein